MRGFFLRVLERAAIDGLDEPVSIGRGILG